jgi:tetratricopeptide (TPR) repeat protein
MYGGPTYINYSQPVVVTPAPVAAQPATQYAQPYPQPGPQYSQPAPPPSGVNPYGISPSASAPPAAQSPEQQRGIALFDAARQAFQIGDYRGAQDQTEKAIAYLPNDSLMHEFRALCMFARGDYKPAAAAIYAVVSAGPGWDWTTVANLYPDISVYSMQLRALEGYCKQNTTSAEARFLLAYHYMLGGHNSEAASLLRDVVQLQPNDQLSAQLLKGLTTPQDQTAEPAQAAAEPDTAVDPASLLGVWKANRPDGSKFELQLTPEHKFSWKFSQQDKQQNITGSYTLANNFLILSASDQNALVGKVALQPGNQLKFKLTSGNPAEPGITFTR